MAKWAFTLGTWTPVAVADATNYTDGGYCAILGGSATQMIKIDGVFMGGHATVSSPTIMLLARDSTIGATITALATPNSAGPLHVHTVALAAVPLCFIATTTKPQRATSITLGKINMSFNAFGGLFRWEAAPGAEWWQYGTATSVGETSLSAFTGGTPGLMGSTIQFEPM